MLQTAALLITSSLVGQAEENKVPQEVRDEMSFLVGTWEVETDLSGEPGTAKYTAHWTKGRDSLFLTYTSSYANGSAVSGWNPTTKEIVETWYSPSLGRLTQRFKPVSKNVWEGTSRAQQPDGKVIEGTIRLEKTGDDSFTFKRTADGKTVTNINRRIKPQPQPTNADRLKAFEYFIGKWKSEEDDGGVITWDFNWGHNKNSVENKIVSTNGEGAVVISNTGILVWDAGNRRFVNTCVNAAGKRIDFLWAKRGEKEWQTWVRGGRDSGDVTIIDKDTWKVKWGDDSGTYKRQDD